MNESTMFVGLDVHKESIEIALAPAGSSEIRHYGRIAGEVEAVDKIIRSLRERHSTLNFVYEAGPCGFALYRHLTKRGFTCAVVSPSLIPKRASDRIKTDKRDAMSLAKLYRSGDIKSVYIPGEEDEAIRDLSRAREDAVITHKRARQQLAALLLRHDIRYPGQRPWTLAHQRWMANVKMPQPSQQIVFQEYMHAVEDANQRVERLTEQLRLATTTWRMAPVVEALQALRGVSLICAASLVSEIGDLSRFDNPRHLMAFIGLVPRQYSSGPHIRLGSITKAGNTHARRMLVEAAWVYRFPARISRGLRDRQEQQPQAVRDIAWKAQVRLCAKYRKLLNKGKLKQVITTAIARELLGFVWAIAREVQPKS